VIPLRDRNPTTRTPYVTFLLIAANVAIFVLVQRGATAPGSDQAEFDYHYAAIPCEITSSHALTAQEVTTDRCERDPLRRGQPLFDDKRIYLSILVSMFLHGSWLHLGGNMLFLWIFGNNIEDKLGPLLYLAFYLTGGFVATIAQTALDPGSVIPLIGASGAIASVMGAYFIWFPKAPVLSLIFIFPVVIRARWLLGWWLISQFFTSSNSGIAWMAHVGGFVFGALVALMVRDTQWWKRRAAPSLQYGYRYP
jgi:membrane associated rhomboid family serine protease